MSVFNALNRNDHGIDHSVKAMNENIKNLIEETVKTSLVEHSSSFIDIKMNDETVISIPVEFCEKFAELVVKECLDIIDDERHNTDVLLSYPRENSGVFNAIQNIKDHFGVE